MLKALLYFVHLLFAWAATLSSNHLSFNSLNDYQPFINQCFINLPMSNSPSESFTQTAKKLYIKTYGCQMNVYDSNKMAELLKPHGFELTPSMDDADLVILNTCHIREKAAEKVYAELGLVKKQKSLQRSQQKEMVIAVAGCVAQAEGEQIFKRASFVDIVVGPQSYHNLPILIEQARRTKKWALDLSFPEHEKFDKVVDTKISQGVSAFLSIQEGCDKFCHFCVVPYTRGVEYSRPVAEIYREAVQLVALGAKEITLLGQNVNAYHGIALQGEIWGIARLIKHLAKIEGLERIRYTTSHPCDMTDPELFEVHASERKLMPLIHLPVQSGSNNILKAMNRKHDRDFYLQVISEFRKANPAIAFTSDFIVGYPGETEQDFEDTLALVKEVNYAHYFAFKYSPRPGTPASILDTQIKSAIQDERLQRLQALLNKQQLAFNKASIGQEMDALFFRGGTKPSQSLGKSPYMQSIIIEDTDNALINQIRKVKITAASQNSLRALLV